jgi:hypothetical protein
MLTCLFSREVSPSLRWMPERSIRTVRSQTDQIKVPRALAARCSELPAKVERQHHGAPRQQPKRGKRRHSCAEDQGRPSSDSWVQSKVLERQARLATLIPTLEWANLTACMTFASALCTAGTGKV